jgi:pimeloyl-ACP methyl ester carboxylesterase
MRFKSFRTVLVLLGLAIGGSAQARWETNTLPGDAASARQGRYLVYLPLTYGDDPQRVWPTVVYLHTRTEWGDDLERLKTNGLTEYLTRHELDAIVVAPQTPQGQSWQPAFIDAVMRDAAARYRVDYTRTYLTGASLGAMGAWSTAIAFPDRFAAFVPISGAIFNDVAALSLGSPLALKSDLVAPLKRLVGLPTWIRYGDADGVVPPAIMARSAALLRDAGGSVRETVARDGGHEQWTTAYDGESGVLDWMLRQEKSDATAWRAGAAPEVQRYSGAYCDSSGEVRATIEPAGSFLKVAWTRSGGADLLIRLDDQHFVGTGLVTFRFGEPSDGAHATAITYLGVSTFEYRCARPKS